MPSTGRTLATAFLAARRRRATLAQAGQVLVLAALGLTVMLGIAGLVIDGGIAAIQRRDAQNAADAGALAGAQDLPGVPAVPTAAEQTAAQNDAVLYATTNQNFGFTGGNVTVNTPPLSGAYAGDSSAVEVIISRQMATLLIGVLGKNTITISARAVARAIPGVTKCVLCVLDPIADGALRASGNGSVTVNGGGVVVDSDASDAAVLIGNGSVTVTDALLATRIGIVGPSGGGSCTQTTGNAAFNPGANCGVTSVPDPLSGLVPPALPGPSLGSVSLSGNSSQRINPGIYSSLQVSANGSLTLNPGIYVLTGGSSALSLSGNGSIVGNGVVVYFACSDYPAPCSSAGQAGAGLSLSGNGSYQLTAPTAATCTDLPATCPYLGLSIFYDRHDTSTLSLTGNGSDNLTGTIYAKSAPATLDGNGGTFQLNSFVVVDTVSLTGNGSIDLSFSQNQNSQAGGSPGAANLVE